MTRIVAGTVGGRTIRTPKGSATRPTSERVREALFSALAARGVLDDARVLDLYAGSGALGLEAASRGASRVLFVESDPRASRVIRSNVDTLGLRGCRVLTRPVTATLAAGPNAPTCGEGPRGARGLVFMDPPYRLSDDPVAADLTALADGWLVDGAWVVVERSTRSPQPAWPPGYEDVEYRRYGETALWLACWIGGTPSRVARVQA